MLNPDRLSACNDWIDSQPEMRHGWLSFETRIMMMRLWEQNDATVARLNARIAQLERAHALPIYDMQIGDKLILQTPMMLKRDQRQALAALINNAMDDPTKRILVLDGNWLFLLVRGVVNVTLADGVDISSNA